MLIFIGDNVDTVIAQKPKTKKKSKITKITKKSLLCFVDVKVYKTRKCDDVLPLKAARRGYLKMDLGPRNTSDKFRWFHLHSLRDATLLGTY